MRGRCHEIDEDRPLAALPTPFLDDNGVPTGGCVSEPFNPPRILRSWVDQVLAGEHDDDRFETFANEVVSAVEGKTIVSTSKSWDLGRDGRGLGPAHGIFVLSSLRTDIDKPKADASRLKATTWKIHHVYYAAPRLVSESVMEDHCKAIHAVLGDDVDVDPLSGGQISELVSSGKAADAFKNHYGGELATIKGALAHDADDPETRHLELALSTFGAKDTRDLRIALGTRLLLGLLIKTPHSLAELAVGSTAALGVPAFSESTVEYYCGILRDGGYLVLKGARFEITEKGRGKHAADSTEPTFRTSPGRYLVDFVGSGGAHGRFSYVQGRRCRQTGGHQGARGPGPGGRSGWPRRS